MSEKITLKAARVNAGLTQKEVAGKMGVSVQTINKWENKSGTIKMGYAKKYVNYLKKY